MKVGVLALQGAFAAHAACLRALGAEPCEVRTPAQLAEVDALVLPGGESTTMSMLLESGGLFDPLADRLADGTAGARDLRRDDPARLRDPRRTGRPALLLGCRHLRAPQRLRPPGRLLRGRPPPGRPGGPALPRRLHPGPVRRAGRARRRGAGHRRRAPRPLPPGSGDGRRLPPGALARPPPPRSLPRGSCDVRSFQVGNHQAQEGGRRRRPRQALRQADPPGGGGGARGGRRPRHEPDAAHDVPEGPRRLGAARHDRAGHQAGHRRSRGRGLRADHLRGLRPRRRGRPHRRPHRQPQPHRRRDAQHVHQVRRVDGRARRGGLAVRAQGQRSWPTGRWPRTT